MGKNDEKEGHDGVLDIASGSLKIGEQLVKVGAEFALFPHKRRTEYSKLIDTAFSTLVDQIEAVRRALREIDNECAIGDKYQVVEHLKRLGSSAMWESMERDMRMCAQLRELHSQMHGFFGERSDKVAGVKRKKLLKLVDYMIDAGEARMADYITNNLGSLAGKAALVAKGGLSLDDVRQDLTKPILVLTNARHALIKLELQARDAVLSKH